MILVSIDPGVTTGYVVGEIEDQYVGAVGLVGLPVLLHAGVTRKLYDLTSLVFYTPSPDVIIIENFRLRRDLADVLTGSEFPTVRTIGAIAMLIELHNHMFEHQIEVVYQEPAVQKFWNRYKMRGVGYNVTPLLKIGRDVRHVYSALSHLLYYVRFTLESEKRDEQVTSDSDIT